MTRTSPTPDFAISPLSNAGDVASAKADDVPQVEMYNDAVVHGSYEENDPVLQQEIIYATGECAEENRWKRVKSSLAQCVARFSYHYVGIKDGTGVVFADMVPGGRSKKSVIAIYAIGFDDDTGTPGHVHDAALAKRGLFAIRYSTHSHLSVRTHFLKDDVVKFAGDETLSDEIYQRYAVEKQKWNPEIAATITYVEDEHTEKGIIICVSHAPRPKNRIVIFFKRPFVIRNEGKTQKAAWEKWKTLYAALAAELGIPYDKSCTDVSRLFFTPRHPEGKHCEIAIFPGALLEWESVPLGNASDQLANEFQNKGGKTKTDEGRDFGPWWRTHSNTYQLADAVEAHVSGFTSANDGIAGACPFADGHSDGGDPNDKAFWVKNAQAGESEHCVAKCHHNSCQGYTTLDFIGKMVKDGLIERSVLDDTQYDAEIIDGEEQVKAGVKPTPDAVFAAIEKLTKQCSPAERDAVIKLIYEAQLGEGDYFLAQQHFEAHTIYSGKKMRIMVGEYAATVKRPQADSDSKGRMVFRFSGDIEFAHATAVCFEALQKKNEKAEEPVICHIDGDPVRLVKDTKGGFTKAKFRHIHNLGLWSELNKLVTFVRQTEKGTGAHGCVPKNVAEHVYEQCYNELKHAPEIIYTPLFLADGSLMITPKYHYFEIPEQEPVNILMIHNKLSVPPILENPTIEDAQEAVAWLKLELLSDFPFFDYDAEGNERREPSEANALAMLITPFMRRMIHGRTPVFFVSKPKEGTGGTLIGKLPMLLFDGEAGAATRYSQNEEEMQKGLIAAVQEQKSHLFFDDVKDFNNRELLRAITQENIGGRLLGSSRNIEVPNRFNWVGTGNNTVIYAEMRRRIVFICLNAKLADIQQRKFRHPDVSGFGYEEFVRKNRSTAIYHILTLIQYWISTGEVPFKDRRRASFEEWSAKVGGVLQACGVEGFLDNLTTVEPDMDEVSVRQFIRKMLEDFKVESPQTSLMLFNWATDGLLDIIEGNNDDMKKSKFMKRLPFLAGQTFSIDEKNYMLQRKYNTDGDVAFQLVKVEHATIESPEMKHG